MRIRGPVNCGIAICTVAVVLSLTIGILHPIITLSENQCLYIYSSAAQVIAAVYGLTIAGYTFLRDKQDGITVEELGLDNIMARILVDDFRHLIFVTVIAILAMLASLLALALRECKSVLIPTVADNLASSLFVSSILFIGNFIFDVMHPDRIANESEVIKVEIAGPLPSEAPGVTAGASEKSNHLQEFLENFNCIERMLVIFAQRYLEPEVDVALRKSGMKTTSKPPRFNWTKPRILDAMLSDRIILPPLHGELRTLVQYRNALVHGEDMTVKAEMVERVKEAHDALKKELISRGFEDPESLG